MSEPPVGSLGLSQIIERKLSFLLNDDITPWDENDNSDLGERDALQVMLIDSIKLTERQFESIYLEKVATFNQRIEGKEFSIEDNDDYYESFSNTLVTILALINPINLYDLSED